MFVLVVFCLFERDLFVAFARSGHDMKMRGFGDRFFPGRVLRIFWATLFHDLSTKIDDSWPA